MAERDGRKKEKSGENRDIGEGEKDVLGRQQRDGKRKGVSGCGKEIKRERDDRREEWIIKKKRERQ